MPPHPRAHPRPRRLRDAALAASAAGFHVFPVQPLGKTPAVEDWEHAATLDPDRIIGWWRARPYNIGVATGPSGLLVIDLDEAHGHLPPLEWPEARGGADVLARLAAAAGAPLPQHTYTVATPSGGHHLYFRQPPGLALRNTQGEHGCGLGWRIDTRGHGGFVVAAGSRRPAGLYRVTVDDPVAELPGWIVTALTPPPVLPPVRPSPSSRPLRRSTARVAAYLAAVVDGEAAAVGAATVGERHVVLLTAARRLGHWVGGGLLDADDVAALLSKAAGHYVNVDGYTAAQVATDIADGLAYGRRRPRTADTIPDRS